MQHDMTQQLHPDIRKVCEDISRLFGLNICGIDIMTSDITRAIHETNGVIIEVNSTPGISGLREMTDINPGKIILKKLFSL